MSWVQESKDNILTKAQHCIPPVNIEIIIENLADKPFYRIEIPSGKSKSYCTQKGIYKIRDDGNNKLLTPQDLLTIFLENESEMFLKRFKEASKELEETINGTFNDILTIKSQLDDIVPQVDELEEYKFMSDDILGAVNEIRNEVDSVNSIAYWNQERIMAILNHLNIEDPHTAHLKNLVNGRIEDYLEDGGTLKREDHIQRLIKTFPTIKEDILELWYDELIEDLKNK